MVGPVKIPQQGNALNIIFPSNSDKNIQWLVQVSFALYTRIWFFCLQGSNKMLFAGLASGPVLSASEEFAGKCSFISTVRPTVHTNPSWKRSFSKRFSNRRNFKPPASHFKMDVSNIRFQISQAGLVSTGSKSERPQAFNSSNTCTCTWKWGKLNARRANNFAAERGILRRVISVKTSKCLTQPLFVFIALLIKAVPRNGKYIIIAGIKTNNTVWFLMPCVSLELISVLYKIKVLFVDLSRNLQIVGFRIYIWLKLSMGQNPSNYQNYI